MKDGSRHRRFDRPVIYRIEVRGLLDRERASWFEGMEISTREEAISILEGPLPDQAALHGVLNSVHSLGLTLLLVERVEKGELE